MNLKQLASFHSFLKDMTGNDNSLYESAMGLYLNIFEGTSTEQALDKLRNAVGDNNLETEGDGIFGLSDEAGFSNTQNPDENLDDAIDLGLENGSLDDFGTAISSETGAPSEGDFGFDEFSEGGDDFGLDLDGTVDEGLDVAGDTEAGDTDAIDALGEEADDTAADGTMDDLDDLDLDIDLTTTESVYIPGKPLIESVVSDWAKSWLSILGTSISVTNGHSADSSADDPSAEINSIMPELDEMIKTNPVLKEHGIDSMESFTAMRFDPAVISRLHKHYVKVGELYSEISNSIQLFPHMDGTSDIGRYRTRIRATMVKLVAALATFTEEMDKLEK